MSEIYPRLKNASGTTIDLAPTAASDGYERHAMLRAIDTEMADGSVVTSYVATGVKYRYVLRWRLLTGVERNAIQGVWDDLTVEAGRDFYPPNESDAVKVTRDVAQYSIDWSSQWAGSAILWDGEIRLRQV